MGHLQEKTAKNYKKIQKKEKKIIRKKNTLINKLKIINTITILRFSLPFQPIKPVNQLIISFLH